MFKRLPLLTTAFCTVVAWSAALPLNAQGTAPAPSSPQILAYGSDITVNPDGTLLVREDITVSAMGAQIKHGFHRDIDTRYQDRFGNPYLIHFEVVSLERDGQPVDFHLEKLSNGLRIDMGKSLDPPGEHTYELTFGIERAIGFFPEYDELYWNVTGNGWILPIQKASAAVHLPKGIAQEAILLDAYTGRQGSAENAFTASADNQSNATFGMTRPLAPYEGLTIVVRWPKGFVSPPTDDQMHRYFLEDNQTSIIGFLGLLVVLVYYTVAWVVVGRRAARGEIPPRSDPPRGFSPAALRYVWRMAFDQKTIMANLVDLAVKKQLAILEDAAGAYILGRLKSGSRPKGGRLGSSEGRAVEIYPDEKIILKRLFAAENTLPLVPINYTLIGGTIEALRHHLRSSLEKVYFLTSARFLIPGLLISFATVVRTGFTIQGGQRPFIVLLSIGLLLWSLGCLTTASLSIAAWKFALSDPHHAPTARKQALIMSATCLLFFLGEVAGLNAMVWAASAGVAIVLILLAVINYLFHILLKAPTHLGRALFDQIEGFRLYLITTETHPRDARAAAPVTPILFEKFLPYAMALNVEKVWGEKFAAALSPTAQAGTGDYSPAWYSGPTWNRITAASFATSLGNSFSSAISLATKAPGSS